MNQAMEVSTTPLFIAAQEGHTAVVAALLAAGAAVNQATLTVAAGGDVTVLLTAHVAFVASVATDPGELVRGFLVALSFEAAAAVSGAGAAPAAPAARPPHCTMEAPLRWAPPAARAAVVALARDMAASQLAAALCLAAPRATTRARRPTLGGARKSPRFTAAVPHLAGSSSLVEVLGADPAGLIASFLQPSSPEARAAVRAMARLHAEAEM